MTQSVSQETCRFVSTITSDIAVLAYSSASVWPNPTRLVSVPRSAFGRAVSVESFSVEVEAMRNH
jgi:hypothetical protein